MVTAPGSAADGCSSVSSRQTDPSLVSNTSSINTETHFLELVHVSGMEVRAVITAKLLFDPHISGMNPVLLGKDEL